MTIPASARPSARPACWSSATTASGAGWACPADPDPTRRRRGLDPPIGRERLRHLPERRRAGSAATPASRSTSQADTSPLARAPAQARSPRGPTAAAARPTATASRRRAAGGTPRASGASTGPSGGWSTTSAPAPGRRAPTRTGPAGPTRPATYARTPRGPPGSSASGTRTPGRSAASRRRSGARRSARERLEPGVGDDDRRVDERRVDPQRQLRVARRVARAGDRPMERVEPADLGPRRRPRPVDDRQVAPQRARQPRPRIGPEVGVLGDAGGDRGWASWSRSARGPAPSSSIASRLSRHASDAGPYSPGSGRRASIVRDRHGVSIEHDIGHHARDVG